MKQIGLYLLAFLLPVVAFAQPGELAEVKDFTDKIIAFINSTVIPLIFAIALLVFIWGMFKFFILGGADDDKRKEGKNLILWSIIGFVLMFSVMGLVNLFATGIGLNSDTVPNLPTVPTVR